MQVLAEIRWGLPRWQSFASTTDVWLQHSSYKTNSKKFTGWSQSSRKKSLSFPGFSRAINLLFHRLSQQKVNVIMTFITGHSTSTDIYWTGSLLPEILMILFTQSTAVLHKYLNDELKILCYNFSLRLHRIPWVFHVQRNPWVFRVFQVCGHPAVRMDVCTTDIGQAVTSTSAVQLLVKIK